MSLYTKICTYTIMGVLSFNISGCEKNKNRVEEQYDSLNGIVFSENYVSSNHVAVFRASAKDSQYSFSVDTKEGRKGIQVEDTRQIKKETIEAMIEPKTKVKILVKKWDLEKRVISVPADRIEVLGE